MLEGKQLGQSAKSNNIPEGDLYSIQSTVASIGDRFAYLELAIETLGGRINPICCEGNTSPQSLNKNPEKVLNAAGPCLSTLRQQHEYLGKLIRQVETITASIQL